MGMEKLSEVSEVSRPEINEFQDIKPQNGMTFDKAKDVVKSMFEGMKSVVDSAEMKMKLREMKEDYIEELKSYSEYKDTLPDQFFDISDLKEVSPEECAKLRKEFNVPTFKDSLKRQWEEENGIPWPKYEKDIIIKNRFGDEVCVRKAGMDYDAHHIQSLKLGGKNEVGNITPLSVEVHFDSQGIHRPGGACDKMVKLLGGEK